MEIETFLSENFIVFNPRHLFYLQKLIVFRRKLSEQFYSYQTKAVRNQHYTTDYPSGPV